MRKFQRLGRFAAIAGLIGAAGLSHVTLAASSFDGQWSVVVITEAGNCDRAYRYAVRVTNGSIAYEGEAGISFSGKVDPKGKLSASVVRGEQRADGTGHLSGTSGAGKWSGRSATEQCSGRWEAEKREG